MLQEGQTLFEDDEGNSHNRELAKAQTIIGMADKWLEKVREVLKADTMTTHTGDDAMNDFMSGSKNSSSIRLNFSKSISQSSEIC